MPSKSDTSLTTLLRDRRAQALVLAGAIAGLLLSPTGQAWLTAPGNAGVVTVLTVVLGALVGAIAFAVLLRWVGSGALWQVDSATVNLPHLGEVTLTVDRRQREAGWRVFVELSTRIATQPLERGNGTLAAALASLYGAFQSLRDELKAVPAPLARPGAREADVEAFVLAVLNHGLRPCLSRWHPRLGAWNRTGLPEARWPLDDACRRDLEATRQSVLAFTHELGRTLKIPSLDRLLPPMQPEPQRPRLMPDTELETLEHALLPAVGDERVRIGWRIFVDLTTRISTQPLPDGSGLLGEALDSLYRVFGNVRELLTELPGPTPVAQASDTVESLALAVLNEDLRPFLAEWHPRLVAWQSQHPDSPETGWPDATACRQALAAMQQRIRSRTARLAALVGVAESGASN